MSSEHTPGPWAVVDATGRTVGAAPNVKVAEVWARDNTDASRIANARLIAAAPELLQVARLAEKCAHGRPGVLCPKCVASVINKAAAAIAKAEGKS